MTPDQHHSGTDDGLVEATSAWFVHHGLPYFVPEERASARVALHSRKARVIFALTALVALGAAIAPAWWLRDASVAPATLILVLGLFLLVYGATALRARPIATWAVARTLSSLRQLLPMVTRALPLLLVFVTFLFINAEVWQVSATLDGGLLWVTVMLFAAVAVVFLLVRLPEELDATDVRQDPARLVEACRATPLEHAAEELAAEHDGVEVPRVAGFERANLLLVLLIVQAVQVLLLSLSVFAFFLLFGAVVMDQGVQESWTGQDSSAMPVLDHLTLELAQVSVFLAAFSGLYFTVYAVTDESYRDQFFTQVKAELDRAVAVRTVYQSLRRRVGAAAAAPR